MDTKRRIILTSIIVMLLITLVVAGTYALWQVTKSQSGVNTLTSSCLDINFSDNGDGIALNNTFPTPDSEGIKGSGYQFTVKNNCNNEISYSVNLEALTNSTNTNYIDESNIKIALDNKVGRALTKYETVNVKKEANARFDKELYVGVLGTSEKDKSKTHSIKMWMDENTPMTEQNKVFDSKVVVVASQTQKGIKESSEDCFLIGSNGLLGYYNNYKCGENIIVPETIKGITAKYMINQTFQKGNVLYYQDTNESKDVYVILDEANYNTLSAAINQFDASESGYETKSIIRYSELSDEVSKDLFSISNSYLNSVSDDAYENDEGSDAYFYIKFMYLKGGTDYSGKTPFDTGGEEHVVGRYNWGGCSYTNEDRPDCFYNLVDLSKLKQLNLGDMEYFTRIKISKLELPEGLEKIAQQMFSNCGLTNVYLPTTIKTIGTSAFYGNDLTELEINSEVTIDSSAFKNNKLNSLTINKTITLGSTSAKPFEGNTSLNQNNVKFGYYSTNTFADLGIS